MRKKAEKIGVTIENASLFRSVVGDFAAHENRSLSAIVELSISCLARLGMSVLHSQRCLKIILQVLTQMRSTQIFSR